MPPLSHRSKNQTGYALIEVLIAAAIVGLVSVTVATGMSLGLRGAATAREGHVVIMTAENLIAGLRSGLPPDELRSLYPDWSISFTETQLPFTPLENEVRPVNAILRTGKGRGFSISIVLLMTSSDIQVYSDAS